jgi:hypothetical protein
MRIARIGSVKDWIAEMTGDVPRYQQLRRIRRSYDRGSHLRGRICLICWTRHQAQGEVMIGDPLRCR